MAPVRTWLWISILAAWTLCPSLAGADGGPRLGELSFSVAGPIENRTSVADITFSLPPPTGGPATCACTEAAPGCVTCTVDATGHTLDVTYTMPTLGESDSGVSPPPSVWLTLTPPEGVPMQLTTPPLRPRPPGTHTDRWTLANTDGTQLFPGTYNAMLWFWEHIEESYPFTDDSDYLWGLFDTARVAVPVLGLAGFTGVGVVEIEMSTDRSGCDGRIIPGEVVVHRENLAPDPTGLGERVVEMTYPLPGGYDNVSMNVTVRLLIDGVVVQTLTRSGSISTCGA